MVCVDNRLLYAAENSRGSQSKIVQLILERDGVGLRCIEEHCIVSYHEDWEKINSMCINENCLFFSNQRGISKLDLSMRQHSLIVVAPNDLCILTKFGSDLLYTRQKSCSSLEIAIKWRCRRFCWKRRFFKCLGKTGQTTPSH